MFSSVPVNWQWCTVTSYLNPCYVGKAHVEAVGWKDAWTKMARGRVAGVVFCSFQVICASQFAIAMGTNSIWDIKIKLARVRGNCLWGTVVLISSPNSKIPLGGEKEMINLASIMLQINKTLGDKCFSWTVRSIHTPSPQIVLLLYSHK